jgi:hypothetical protein
MSKIIKKIKTTKITFSNKLEVEPLGPRLFTGK